MVFGAITEAQFGGVEGVVIDGLLLEGDTMRAEGHRAQHRGQEYKEEQGEARHGRKKKVQLGFAEKRGDRHSQSSEKLLSTQKCIPAL